MNDEIQFNGKLYRVVEDEPYFDLRLDPTRKQEGGVAMIAIVGERLLPILVADNASIVDVISQLKSGHLMPPLDLPTPPSGSGSE